MMESFLYDALAENENPLRELDEDVLKKIAQEFMEKLRVTISVDW